MATNAHAPAVRNLSNEDSGGYDALGSLSLADATKYANRSGITDAQAIFASIREFANQALGNIEAGRIEEVAVDLESLRDLAMEAEALEARRPPLESSTRLRTGTT